MKALKTSLAGLLLLFFLFFFAPEAFSQNKKRDYSPRLGLVLSGGGAKGFAHIGALKVFEEAGLQFDYVSGTSMGSIFGSLYALGYHPDTMEKMVRNQDWDALMNDKVDRRYIPIEEKQNSDRFLIVFPIVENRVTTKIGLRTGQMVDLLLAKYLSPAYKVNNFSKLPIPFLCIGTDLSDGSNIVLDQGVLQKAVRASMSIPSYFNPITIDGRLLVDGGVINNFPVSEMKKKGMDVIVGVDVQTGLLESKNISTVFQVLDQVTSFYRVANNTKAVSLTDYYIKPDLKEFDMMSFSNYDTIIKRGEMAARAMLPQLQRLADSIQRFKPKKQRVLDARPLDSIFITQFTYHGNSKVSKEYLDGAFDFEPMSWIKIEDLDHALKRAYGSGFFELISYYFVPTELGAELVFEIKESSSGIFGAGVHYDSDYKVGLLLNATFKNVGIKGSKTFVDLNLGENPRLQGLFLVDRGSKIGFGLSATGLNLKLNFYQNEDIQDFYSINLYNLAVFGQWTFANTMRLRAGTRYETTKIKSGLGDNNLSQTFKPFLISTVSWDVDTYNRNSFSTNGIQMNLTLKHILPLTDDVVSNLQSNAFMVSFRYRNNIPLNRLSTIKTGLSSGLTIQDKRPAPVYNFFLGGQSQTNYLDGFVPFTGLKFVEKIGLYHLVGNFAWQYNIYRKFYLTTKLDAGVISDTWEGITFKSRLLVGYGLTVGYDSFVGPVELTLMGSNENAAMGMFINIGYWF
jgi:NTE family protein